MSREVVLEGRCKAAITVWLRYVINSDSGVKSYTNLAILSEEFAQMSNFGIELAFVN